ncbi:MAG: FAD-dependent thymidylate synthase [Bdellovibrionota bacterium]
MAQPAEKVQNETQIFREPKVTLVSKQVFLDQGAEDVTGLAQFTDTPVPAEKLVEFGGRVCYMSYGKGRKTNHEYIEHLLQSGHGSVLEHAVFSFCFEGVSRSLTHELIRHRAGFAYSQLSQRYVDESYAAYVEPEIIAQDPKLHAKWMKVIETCQDAYRDLVEGLLEKTNTLYPNDKTHARKEARQAARSVLPNATETKIVVTANARAWRHFMEMRGSEGAETEIRKLAVAVCRILQKESPNLFGDYKVVPLKGGGEVVETPYKKV